MHPTPEEQLNAILRLIEDAASDSRMAEEPKALLADAGRLIRRLERSWSSRLPFLTRDNELAIELLSEIGPLLPVLQKKIDALAGTATQPDEPSSHAVNKQCQELLSEAVHLLPDDSAGDNGRARIVAYLRSRLAADPALNRTPTDR